MSTKVMRPTHRQIADRVGVSRSKVTEVLHGTRGSRVSPETRLRIVRAAEEIGYQPRNRTTHNIGCVFSVENLELEAETMFLRYVQQALREAGYRLTLADFDPAAPSTLRNTLNPKTVDGVIFMHWYKGAVAGTLAPEIPWVLASDEGDVPDDIDMVALDAARSAANITQVLLEAGHRRICLIVGAMDVKYHHQVKRGVREALRAAGVPETLLRIIELSTNHDIAVPLRAAMREASAPTAVLTTNPSQAVPALHALIAAGCRVPQDVSLASVTNSRQFDVIEPAITSTTAFGYELARAVVQRLMARIQHPATSPQHILMPAQIITRQSVAQI
jgi:DNA-binding LacI/PurR family transcriptional regulator